MDRTRGYCAKQNKSIAERQLSYPLTDMKNWSNKTEDHRGTERKINQDKTRKGNKP